MLTELLGALLEAMGSLTEREVEAIRYRFGMMDSRKPLIYKDIGLAMGVTIERVKQLVAKGLRKLRRRNLGHYEKLKRFTPYVDSAKYVSPISTTEA